MIKVFYRVLPLIVMLLVLTQSVLSKNIGSSTLSFTKNHGQWDGKIKFRADVNGAIMWFGADGVFYQFTRSVGSEIESVDSQIDKKDRKISENKIDSYESIMIKATFVGANSNLQIVGVDEVDYKTNYFLGQDESRWATNVPAYTAVIYENIYNGIDLQYYGNDLQMEYDFIVSPGVDYSQIKIQYEGVDAVTVNDAGELVVTTMWGEVVEQRPVIYQIKDGSRIYIEGSYLLQDNNSFSFELADYNTDLPLVIDPIITYSTYLGGASSDDGASIAVDDAGNAYIVGRTSSADFPVFNAYSDTIQGSGDAIISKFNSYGNVIFSTYFGSASGTGIVLDDAGSIYICGSAGVDLPTVNPYIDTAQGNADGFIAKFNNSGDSLIFSTYFGGSGADYAEHIEVDASGSVYLGGYTGSTDLPVLNAYQPTYQGVSYDIFVAKFNSAGSGLIYSTYLGGTAQDYSEGFAVDASGNAYISGGTQSTDFPTTANAFQETHQGGYQDVFVTKLNSSGNGLVYSTYLGSTLEDYGADIAVDDNGDLYLVGETDSDNFPLVNPIQSSNPGVEYWGLFVSKLNSTGTALIYSTYMASGGDEDGMGLAIDQTGAVYVIADTDASSFPLENPIQSTYGGGGSDVVFFKINPAGDSLVFSTYLGGSGQDYPNDVAVDIAGSAYVTGRTRSTNFPRVNAYQTSNKGSYDGFVTMYKADLISFDEVVNPGANVAAFGSNGQTITFDSVETSGSVSVEYTPVGPEVDPNLLVLPTASLLYYNISSTAGFVGNVEVCFEYNPADVISEDQIAIYHYDSTSTWVDITTSIDTATNTVCGVTDHFSPFAVVVPKIALSVEQLDTPNLPKNFSLSQNYPNPFNPSTMIEFHLPTKSFVTIEVYNLLGQQVRQLVSQDLSAGSYQVEWDGKSSNGTQTSSGIYFYRIVTEDFSETKKMLLLK